MDTFPNPSNRAPSLEKPLAAQMEKSWKPFDRSIPVSTPLNQQLLRHILVTPVVLHFGKDGEKTEASAELQVKCIGEHRIAWRVLGTAPKRYLVFPSTGFLVPNEIIKISIKMFDVNKYSKRHSFLVQASRVKETINNRRVLWKLIGLAPKRMNELQNVRVFTGLFSRLAGHSLETSPTIVPSGVNVAESPSQSTTSIATPHTSAIDLHEKPGQEKKVNEVLNSEINYWVDKVTKAIHQKALSSSRLLKLVNEMKMLEVELDRLHSTVIHLGARITTLSEQGNGGLTRTLY
ncbi:unnamed protein product, partial [Mesorhabditis belari]|uniref:Major sperm protein n=1 Tax=Mesorhabditis belari TaxID=2138241 RepID=A0AAF3JAB2_9BILA